MGLDMYLNKVKKEEVAYWRKANAVLDWFERRFKENHGIEEIENCQSYYVSKEDLEDLKKDCEAVINASELEYSEVTGGYEYDGNGNKQPRYIVEKVIKDPTVAKKLLPSRSGFFYGSTAYDEYYLEKLKSTVEQIDKVLKETDFDEYNLEFVAWW